jgi:hypothetical protein
MIDRLIIPRRQDSILFSPDLDFKLNDAIAFLLNKRCNSAKMKNIPSGRDDEKDRNKLEGKLNVI